MRKKTKDTVSHVAISKKDGTSDSPVLAHYPTHTALDPKPTPVSPSAVYVDHQDLPENYSTTQLTLIARDPYWIHAYWDLPSNIFEQLGRKCGQDLSFVSLTLRMYDVTLIDFNDNNANHWFDIEVGHDTRSWYVNLWQDHVSFCADLGVKSSDGRFWPIARSNVVTTPRVTFSDRTDMIWMEVKEEQTPKPFMFVEKNGPLGRHPYAADKKLSAKDKRRRRRVLLSENDIRAYYAKLFPLLRKLGSFKSITELGDRVLGLDLSEGAECSVIEGFSKSYRPGRRVGASEELIDQPDHQGASESVSSFVGASEHSAVAAKRQFFFEIGAELIVYGRTEPNATVTLGGKNIPLNPDGTFSLRYALPDGKFPFDFAAQSFDKVEVRYISTSVERTQTHYNP